MGAMFRSEQMTLAQVFVQPEAAYFTISDLGECGIVQFRDLNEDLSAFQRKFVGEVKRCDEMERKLRYMEKEVKKAKVQIVDVAEMPKAPNPREVIDLEAHIEKTESDIKELSENFVTLKSSYLELMEVRHVLEKTHAFFSQEGQAQGIDASQISHEESGQLGFIAGVINRARLSAFERMLWIASRGNVFLKRADIEEQLEDPATGDEIYKTVFVAFFQGERLKNRVKKICEGFHASVYPCSHSFEERQKMLKDVNQRLKDLKTVLNQTEDHLQRVLLSVSKELQNWSIMVRKMKAVYHTLNLFNVDVTKKCLIGECWIPTRDIEIVRQVLTNASSKGGSSIPSFMNVIRTNEIPPTFNRTNKFTRGFQNLIDAYGVASYREANPALYTIITFPFLFAVMFGDLGHGIILFLFGLSMVLQEKKLQAKKMESEIQSIFFGGRYIILLMGLFSIYTGFVYNDVFSLSMNIFQSSWKIDYNESTVLTNEVLQLDPETDYTQTPYFIGLDPAWQLADNKIIFLNSYKMKLSIIFGIIHMIFGVCVSVVNFMHFRKYSSILLEFLPQIVFLCALFLWMVVMMFMKWIMYGPQKEEKAFGPACAPSVLIYFINMMLFKSQAAEGDCREYMFEAQPTVQMTLVFVALICIPIMLLGKPLYIKCTRRPRRHVVNSNGNAEAGAVQKPSSAEHDEEEEELSEIFIHQAIHTIEYVLSTVSHTASYLRLWALSLAHAQLSEVLWSMVLHMGLTQSSYVGSVFLFVIFGVWASFTLSILVMMEGLSAFLHTLRLHWVEFMSKFYVGAGYPFQPFSFKAVFDEEEKAAE